MEVALTLAETENLTRLEVTIERGFQTFVEVGAALLDIRDGRLYRTQYGTFEEYCRGRWGMTDRRARQLMTAAETVSNLKSGTIVPVLPQTESQVRPLSKLTPQLQTTVWPIVVDTAPGGKITANHVQQVVDDYLRSDEYSDAALTETAPLASEEKPFNYKRDNRHSVAADIYTPLGTDACQTPPYALDPLLPYLSREWVIWEPARGEGLLEEALYDGGCGTVISGDILTGQNFFDYEPARWNCLITNPPWSIQEPWLERCCQLDKPFALLLKVEVLGNKGIQALIRRYGFEMLLLDQRIDFKMPYKGWDSSATFPTFWLCRLFLPGKVVFGSIEEGKRQFKQGSRIAR